MKATISTVTAGSSGGLVEVCDPVEDQTYQLDGVQVSDFALPSYFGAGPGPWDEADRLTGPLNA